MCETRSNFMKHFQDEAVSDSSCRPKKVDDFILNFLSLKSTIYDIFNL